MHPHERSEAERGHALVLSIIGVAMAVAITAALNQVAHRASQRAAQIQGGVQLESALSLGLAQGRLAVWERFQREEEGGALSALRAWLDDEGLGDEQAAWVTPGGALSSAEPDAGALRLGRGLGAERTTVQVQVRRTDDADSTFLVLVAEAVDGRGRRASREQVLRLGAPQWSGFRYALLGQNLNCVICHTRVDNVTRVFGGAGPHPRVKVASLETVRVDADASSLLAGTLYTRGKVLDPSGTPVVAPAGGPLGIRSTTLDAGDGTIVGAPFVDLVDGTPSSTPFSNFYQDYPADPSLQFDGSLPTGFPPVIPDTDGDRQVDNGEWSARATGTSGRVTGGVIVGLGKGIPLPGISLPTVGNLLTLPSNTPNQNAILIGSSLLPLRIEGTVAIDGDLIITGKIRGSGQLLVRGNIYVIGDLEYADGTDGSGNRTFGLASDGSPNVVAYTAGGSIIHGAYNLDYQNPLIPMLPLPTLVTDGNLTGFTGQQVGLFNRMEWTKTQPFFDPATQTLTTTDTGVPNSAYVPGYKARYYSMRDGQQPKMFLAPGNTWDNTNGAWRGPEKGDPNVNLTVAGHEVHGLGPDLNWVPPLVLGTLHTANDLLRPSGAYRIDGLLYSDNAVLLNADRATKGRGQVVVNGAVLGADVGAAVPGTASGGLGLQVNYDDRVRQFVHVEDPAAASVAVFTVYQRTR